MKNNLSHPTRLPGCDPGSCQQPPQLFTRLRILILALALGLGFSAEKADAASLNITTKTLPNATNGIPYSQTLSATGGQPPYTWVVAAGGLPDGLSLGASTGIVGGTPAASGTWEFNYPFQAYIEVTDSHGATAARSYGMSLLPPPAAPPSTPTYTLTVVNGSGGGTKASGATATITANAAPAGEVFSGWTGATVANASSSSTTLVMPAANTTVTATYKAQVQPLAIVPTNLPPAMVGTPYDQALIATGGVPPYTWAVLAGGLPQGITLDPTNGVISGIETDSAAWIFNYTNDAYIGVTDSVGSVAAMTFEIAVVPSTNVTYPLTVNSGSGSGSYVANTPVTITANPPQTGWVFLGWTGAAVANAQSATTTLVMPPAATTVTATYSNTAPQFALTVASGTGSGSYGVGTTVTITANAAPANEAFSGWTGATVANAQAASTTLVMPAANTTVTASYAVLPPPGPTYSLTVVNGAGSGSYQAGTVVTISGNQAPAGQVFQAWVGASVANSSAVSTTLVMPANAVTVTAIYGATANPPATIPFPVASHPRLWITTNDIPKLQSWAVASNPIYEQGILPLLWKVISDYQTAFFPGGVTNNPYPDLGDTQGYQGLLTEQEAYVLALHSLIDPNPTNRIQYAQYARNLIMVAMNQAALGPLSGAPFRDPLFPTYNRANEASEGWPLVVDWIYNATNAQGNPILTAQDKATIRTVFMLWATECLNASTTGGDHPSPVGTINNVALIPGGNAYRMAANNYYNGHARLLTLMALAIDPADDPPVDPSLPVSVIGNSLRSYIADATGAWLYQQYAMFGDPASVCAAYGLPTNSSVGLASGGLPPEGMLYGHSMVAIIGELLALKTAGFADPTLSGPQVALANNPPLWDKYVRGMISSLVPLQQIPASETWNGLVYEYASYGDILRMFATPDMMMPFGLLGVLDQKNGDTSRLNAERWFLINAVQGGAPQLLTRIQDPWTWGVQDGLFAFLLLDPNATTTDPRPAYSTSFYDPGAGRLVDRTDWTPSATMFDFRSSWQSINHQQADAGLFELYRNGEWLTKSVANYDNNVYGLTSPYHNSLGLENWCANGFPANLGWWEPLFWTNGSSWQLGDSAGDPVTISSVQTAYDYLYTDMTELYNRPSPWSPANAALDILHASRSIIWLKPDYIVVYDRDTSQHPGFKTFNLALTTQPVVNGNVITSTTPGGQNLHITPLLPANSAYSASSIVGLMNPIADLEPSTSLITLQDPTDPTDTRFLHVLQGTDAGGAATPATLFHQTSGTLMDGALFATNAVLFVVDSTVLFNGVTYTTPSTATNHYVTGLVPGAFYSVASAATVGGVAVTITPSGATGYQADAAGVLQLSF